MCCRYILPRGGGFQPFSEISERLAARGISFREGELAPGDLAPVLANNRRLEPAPFAMKWGYRLPDGKLVFNARSETAAEKPMFADGFARRRCLLPAGAYFEWQGKQKYVIRPRGEEGFFLAGIYRLEQNAPVFTVLTRAPSESVAFVHDRMPVLLPESAGNAWLDPSVPARETLSSALLDLEPVLCEA